MIETVSDLLFAPPTENWKRLSPRYTLVRRLGVLLTWPVFWGVLAALGWWLVAPWAGLVIAGLGLALTAWRWWRMAALVRSWGYAELADDLYITHGLWFKELIAVPYGRMQVVEVKAGPIERAFGVATITLVTASASTDATIPGLPPEEAARLRDRLTELGESRMSGL